MDRKQLITVVTTILLACVSGCGGTPTDETGGQKNLPTAEVKAITVTTQPARHQNEVTGTVEAVQRTTIAAKISGSIEKIPVELGSAVRKGDLLVLISAEEINARLAQTKAQLDQATRNFEREKRLLEKEASTQETVKSMEDAYLIAKAGFDEASTMLGYTKITAPFDGVIAMKNAQAGDLATPGAPLLTLENNRELQVLAQVPETLALQSRIGDRLSVRLPGTGLDKEGVVSEIAPSADPMSRTTTVKLQINGDSSLRPGQYVLVVLPGDTVDTLLVPATAISRYGQMERLFVVQGSTAKLRLVRTGESYDGQLEILTGLNAGEQVVIEGGDLLLDGQPVKILPQ